MVPIEHRKGGGVHPIIQADAALRRGLIPALNVRNDDVPPCDKDWIDVLSALLTPTIAIAAVVITTLQWKIDRNRLKHELFDRRYRQYCAVTEFLGSIMANGKVLLEDQREYLTGTTGMEFTFSPEISSYLHKNVWCIAVDLKATQDEFEGLPVGDDRSRLAHRAADIRKKLYEEYKNIENLFRPYLQISQ